jgi:hypothetical protein
MYGTNIRNAGKNIQIIEPNETYFDVNTTMTNVPKAIKPNHGEIANNTPPVEATPLPPDLFLASLKLNLEVNNLIKY